MTREKEIIPEIIIVGNARSYHTMDWYRTIKRICKTQNVIFATDLIESENYLKIIHDDDKIEDLYNIDWLLFTKQTSTGNLWRNTVKFILLPFQILKLRKLFDKYPYATYHAHTMYYILLCWLARIKFIATPMGSEILVRSERSFIYRYFAIKALAAADNILVDSENLKIKIHNLCSKRIFVIQNGIDVTLINQSITNIKKTFNIVSFRAMAPIYCIEEIIKARDASKNKLPMSFIYPFWQDEYKGNLSFNPMDSDLGRLPRDEMYNLLKAAALAISIPRSDSSPRSVYEAIFCGCCVAVTYNPWIENLPSCMRERLYIVDINDEEWFDKAYEFAISITSNRYKPSENALELFDQEKTMTKVAELFYK
jgi:hypothetical protein